MNSNLLTPLHSFIHSCYTSSFNKYITVWSNNRFIYLSISKEHFSLCFSSVSRQRLWLIQALLHLSCKTPKSLITFSPISMKFMLAMVSNIRKNYDFYLLIVQTWHLQIISSSKKNRGVTDKCAFADRILQVSIQAACVILKETLVELIYF
jgi:hypothetical protein